MDTSTLASSPGAASVAESTVTTATTTAPQTAAAANPNAPPRPDRRKHDIIKAKYRKLQQKYTKLSENSTSLKAELERSQSKVQKLQDECNLLLDQVDPINTLSIPEQELELDAYFSQPQSRSSSVSSAATTSPQPDILQEIHQRTSLDSDLYPTAFSKRKQNPGNENNDNNDMDIDHLDQDQDQEAISTFTNNDQTFDKYRPGPEPSISPVSSPGS